MDSHSFYIQPFSTVLLRQLHFSDTPCLMSLSFMWLFFVSPFEILHPLTFAVSLSPSLPCGHYISPTFLFHNHPVSPIPCSLIPCIHTLPLPPGLEDIRETSWLRDSSLGAGREEAVGRGRVLPRLPNMSTLYDRRQWENDSPDMGVTALIREWQPRRGSDSTDTGVTAPTREWQPWHGSDSPTMPDATPHNHTHFYL